MKSKYSIFILATISIYLGIIETTNTFAQSPYDSDIIFNEYDIVMDLDFASNAVEFEVRICANNLSKVDKTFIDCGLCTITNNREIVVRNLNVFQMHGDMLETVNYERRSVPDYGQIKYRILLNELLQANQSINLVFQYQLRGSKTRDNLPMWHSTKPELYLLTDFNWLPIVYLNTKPGQFANLPKPAWKLTLKYPSNYTAYVDGQSNQQYIENDKKVEEWTSLIHGMPHVFVAEYTRIEHQKDDVTIQFLSTEDPAVQNSASAMLEDLAQLLAIYVSFLGDPGSTTYTVVSSYTNGGGHACYMGQVVSQSFVKSRMLDTLAHEMAHTWWAESVSSYGDGSKFLREAMAQFCYAWAFKELIGGDAFERIMASFKNNVFTKQPPLHNYPLIVQDGCDLQGISGANYFKGPLVLNTLRYELGDDIFFDSLQAFYNKYRDGNVNIYDFIENVQSISKQDLSLLFHNLFWSTDYPQYALESLLSSKEGDRYKNIITIENKGNIGYYCPITLESGDETIQTLFKVDGQGRQEFIYYTDFPVSKVQIDPKNNAFHYGPNQQIVTCVKDWIELHE